MPPDRGLGDYVVKAVKVGGTQDCFTTYSNLAQVIATAFDIQIVFAEMVETEDEVVKAQPKARIVMSPEQAMLLVHSLSSRLDHFQQANGPLRTQALEALTTNSRSIPIQIDRNYSLWKDIRGFLAVSTDKNSPAPVVGYLIPSGDRWLIEGQLPEILYENADDAAKTLLSRSNESP